ncbi:MAG TPA: hypothetical protein EYP25_01570, partial [Anaerolineae bacterium]|nr:hypothetical protein [Anaerolineae bacterium]
MYEKRYLFIIALAVTMLFTSACTVSLPAVRSGTAIITAPTPDPWTQAVDDAQKALAESELDAHFQYYQDAADDIDDYLAQLKKIRPALKLIDALKHMNLPVVGNGWEFIVNALDKAHAGAGAALEQVDEDLRDLLNSYERLQRLDELDRTRAAIQAFQANPSQGALEALGEEMARADFILAGVDKDAADLLDRVNALL